MMTRTSMYRTLLLLLAVPAALHAQTAGAGGSAARPSFPPEWAPHEAVWMGWSGDTTHHAIQVQMIRAMVPHVAIRLMVTSDSVRTHAAGALRAAGVDPNRVVYVQHEIPNFWTRDPGPLFLSDGQQLTVARFAWDDYGYPKELRTYDPRLLRRGELGRDLAERLGLPSVSTQLVAEGGGLEVSSDVILSYRQTAIQRNPGVPMEEIEREYLRVYGKEKVVWLSRSPLADRVFSGPKLANYFGMGANGHIDEYARFVNDSTIVVAQIDSADAAADPLSAVDREILLENLAELRAARNVDGRPFHIVTLPSPGLHHHMWTGPLAEWMKARDRLDAWFREFRVGDEIHWVPGVSYLNFFITNGVVLVSAYWREGLPEREREKDEEVRATLQRLFPDREIVQIDPLAVNFSGGGMHCITQQQPAVE
jgi:agmatine deiminase